MGENQLIQSGVKATSNKDLIPIESEAEAELKIEDNKSKQEVDDYQEFDDSKDQPQEILLRESKIKSEEQGKNLSFEYKELNTHRTLDDKFRNKSKRSPKLIESEKHFTPAADLMHVEVETEVVQQPPVKRRSVLSKGKTVKMNDDQPDLFNDSSIDTQALRKLEGKTTPGSRAENLFTKRNLLADSKANKEELKLLLDKLTPHSRTFFNEKDTLSYDFAEEAVWKSTPLFTIAHGCESENDIINVLLDIENIDCRRAGIHDFADLEIIEYENEVNIILQALKRKVKIETLIINSSVEDSKESNPGAVIPSRNDAHDALHTFVHTSRYIIILENTLRYLLH